MATLFNVEHRINIDCGPRGIYDQIIIVGADSDGEDLVLEVAPTEDREPYDAAIRAAGFEPVGDDQARKE